MSKLNEDYVGEINAIKRDLIALTKHYIKKNFPHLYNQKTEIVAEKYCSAPLCQAMRFFSSSAFHGEGDFNCAKAALESFEKEHDIYRLLHRAVFATGDGKLHEKIVEHLVQNAVVLDEQEDRELIKVAEVGGMNGGLLIEKNIHEIREKLLIRAMDKYIPLTTYSIHQ